MAKPIDFQTQTDPRKELECKLAAAPKEHAEALLAAMELLETAHQKGILDLMRGAIGSKNAIAAKVSEYAAEQQSTQMMRNLLVLGKVLSNIDLSQVMDPSVEAKRHKSPSLWQSFKILWSEEGKCGIYSVALFLRAFGGSSKRVE